MLSILFLLAHPLVPEDTIQVPEDAKSLREAVAQAPPGGVIELDGGVFGPIVVGRDLTIVGNGARIVPDPEEGARSAVTLNGPGVGEVVLQGLIIGGTEVSSTLPTADPAVRPTNPPMIVGGGFEELVLEDCEVHAARWEPEPAPSPGPLARDVTTVPLAGAPAMAVDVALVHVQRSVLTAAPPLGVGFAGEPAIRAPGTVTAVDSVLEASEPASTGDDPVVWLRRSPVDAPLFVQGRSDVDGGAVLNSGEPLTESGLALDAGPGPLPGSFWRETLRASGAVLGEDLDVAIENEGWTVLWAARGLGRIVETDAGPFVLEAPILGRWVRMGPTTFSMPVPLDADLVGVPIAFQAADAGKGLTVPLHRTLTR